MAIPGYGPECIDNNFLNIMILYKKGTSSSLVNGFEIFHTIQFYIYNPIPFQELI